MQPSEAQGDTYRENQLRERPGQKLEPRERPGQKPEQGSQPGRMGPQRGEQWQLDDWKRLVGQSD